MRRFLLATVLVPLAACNSGPTVTATNASVAEVSAKVADVTAGGDLMSPGRWEGTMTINGMKLDDLPADLRSKMEAEMSKPQPLVQCITEKDVKAQRALFAGAENDKNCTYSRFKMGGGKLDAMMSCNTGGEVTNTAITAKYSSDSYHMETVSKADGASSAPETTMTVDTKRTGACRGTEGKE